MKFLEFIYYLGYSAKKRSALKNQNKLPSEVVSIGNITLGGTGKTPATIALAEEAQKRGLNPCILTRGYKGNAKGTCFVSIGEGPLLNEHQVGDEAFLMSEKLIDIPIVKSKDRYEAGMFAIQNLKSRFLFILDDGFQHWKLFRDKDILLIDGTNPFGNRNLFPQGSLREPLEAINRADIIVITKVPIDQQSALINQKSGDTPSPLEGEGKGGGQCRQRLGVKDLSEEIRRYNPKALIFFAEHKPSKFIKTNGESMSIDWAKNKRFYGFCGIGNPESFKNTLLSSDIELTGFQTFKDHYRYSKNDIQSISKNADKSGSEWIVTTEKDIMRLKGFYIPENFVALSITFSIDEEFYNEIFSTIKILRPRGEHGGSDG
jgi:tetraacyldisaccharide 4'-kinase